MATGFPQVPRQSVEVVAEIQTIEPSDFALTAESALGAPPASISFSILMPHILVDKVIVTHAPEDTLNALKENLQGREGREFNSGQDWLVQSDLTEELVNKGYLDSQITVSHDSPRKSGANYLVNLLVEVSPGPLFHVGAMTADGGPLLEGRDLSLYFTQKPGDVAGNGPFGRLAVEIRALYWHHGYADVAIAAPPELDRSRALVSYHLKVDPGPLYRLHSLTVSNLNLEQETRVRELLKMKPGDVFDEMAINSLYHKIEKDPLLAHYGFTFSPAKDKATAKVDLSLDFYKVSDNSSVTVK